MKVSRTIQVVRFTKSDQPANSSWLSSAEGSNQKQEPNSVTLDQMDWSPHCVLSEAKAYLHFLFRGGGETAPLTKLWICVWQLMLERSRKKPNSVNLHLDCFVKQDEFLSRSNRDIAERFVSDTQLLTFVKSLSWETIDFRCSTQYK